VLLEGIKIKAKRIPKKQLVAACKALSDKPFPKVNPLRLSDEDFNRLIEHRRCPEDNLREVEEWERLLSTRGTDAWVLMLRKRERRDYILLIRKNPYHSLDEILRYELTQIA
jgi:hypothetical protein